VSHLSDVICFSCIPFPSFPFREMPKNSTKLGLSKNL
jgi:hypothetical protein